MVFLNIHRYCSNHWLVGSDCLLVCGWYAMLMFLVIPSWLSSSHVKDPVKCGSQSVMIFCGIL